MDTYDAAAARSTAAITHLFSTSFSASTRLLGRNNRQDVYNVYGLVRIADEIVDTYEGVDAAEILDELEADVYRAMRVGFSANIVVHSFCLTARTYNIPLSLITPFFKSMRMDLANRVYDKESYKKYIYGSADVVGLMCLMVFVGGSQKEYKKLEKGAAALGSAFQKINFLRDLKDDYEVRGRYYFPVGSYQDFNEHTKRIIEEDITKDFANAYGYIKRLPSSSRKATLLAYTYYRKLQEKLAKARAEEIREKRIRVSNITKILLYMRVRLGLL